MVILLQHCATKSSGPTLPLDKALQTIKLIDFLKKLKTGSSNKPKNLFYFNAVLDASGFVGSGFVWGNNYWLGSQRACNFVNSPVRVALAENPPKNHIPNLTEIAAPIPVGYRVVWAKHYSKWQLDIKTFDKAILHIGLCVPQSCTNDDLHILANAMLTSDHFNSKYIVNGNFSVIGAKSLVLRDEFLSNPLVYSFV